MNGLIARVARVLFPDTLKKVEEYGYLRGYNARMDDQYKEREKWAIADFEAHHEIGEWIIAVPNEHQDMIIGQIISHDTISKAKSPVAWVYDYVRGEEIMLWQRPYPYTESLARNVANLHPSDRHVLFYRSEKDFACVDEETIIGWDLMQKRLEENGFFAALNKNRC